MIYKALHRKLKIDQHEIHWNRGKLKWTGSLSVEDVQNFHWSQNTDHFKPWRFPWLQYKQRYYMEKFES
jgi:hypothetical protein